MLFAFGAQTGCRYAECDKSSCGRSGVKAGASKDVKPSLRYRYLYIGILVPHLWWVETVGCYGGIMQRFNTATGCKIMAKWVPF
jgi:hypothetical protein